MRSKKNDKEKQKTKRKRGKKFVFRKEFSTTPQQKKNPFEELSQKKYLKIGQEVIYHLSP